ncbi:mechanosensitive ion channel family protein [Kiloniella laminariae]|uniref:mechanosensitive ion channel family protein n=1 Tax=Kiloniella laminariae TaxID=454162 RepID=UPI0003A5D29E|nr:mechanosensitive ion channel domain-containing protein [Kiloniella laminariae]
MTHQRLHQLYRVGLFMMMLLFGNNLALAQTALPLPDNSAPSVTAPAFSEPITRQAVRDILSGLSDVQARELLLQELDQKIALREKELAKKSEESATDVIIGWGTALQQSWLKTIHATPYMAPKITTTFANFAAKRENSSLWRIPLVLLICFLAGGLATGFVRQVTKQQRARLDQSHPTGLWSRMKIISARFALQGIQLLAFVAAAFMADKVINASDPMDRIFVRYVIEAVGYTVFAIMLARFVMSPDRPDLRLCNLDDDSAKLFTRRTAIIFAIASFFIGHMTNLNQFGWEDAEVRIQVWIFLAFNLLIILTFWQGRKSITTAILGNEKSSRTWQKFAEIWPLIAIGLVALQWLVVELYIATGNVKSLSPTAINLTLIILMSLPLLELAIPAVVLSIWPKNPEHPPALQAAHKLTQAGLIRFGRIIAVSLLVLGIAKLWGLDLRDLASQGVGAQFARALVEIVIISFIAYGLSELLNIFADRQVAIERVTMGIDAEGDSQSDGEGGQGGTRLGTLMPLIRWTGLTFILIMAFLSILEQLGINVTPLLAGAGIVGLAVGFGAQTLVKDIFSGIFFLIDDAFRKGEYIDVGSVKGTVEKISIRSMQLRHHKGPLNTIPFGEISYLTNFSRDWIIMKLPLRLTYDTDANKVRKMIKKLGEELLTHPEIGHMFLNPLKSQGVMAMEDSAMIMRVKFTTRPGDQFVVRRFVLNEIHKLFNANGIQFANREVTVRLADNSTEKRLDNADKQIITSAARVIIDESDQEKKV